MGFRPTRRSLLSSNFKEILPQLVHRECPNPEKKEKLISSFAQLWKARNDNEDTIVDMQKESRHIPVTFFPKLDNLDLLSNSLEVKLRDLTVPFSASRTKLRVLCTYEFYAKGRNCTNRGQKRIIINTV